MNCFVENNMIMVHKIYSRNNFKNTRRHQIIIVRIWFKMNDKIERMKTLLLRNGENSVEGEPVTDSFQMYQIMELWTSRGKRVNGKNKL